MVHLRARDGWVSFTPEAIRPRPDIKCRPRHTVLEPSSQGFGHASNRIAIDTGTVRLCPSCQDAIRMRVPAWPGTQRCGTRRTSLWRGSSFNVPTHQVSCCRTSCMYSYTRCIFVDFNRSPRTGNHLEVRLWKLKLQYRYRY